MFVFDENCCQTRLLKFWKQINYIFHNYKSSVKNYYEISILYLIWWLVSKLGPDVNSFLCLSAYSCFMDTIRLIYLRRW